MRNQHQHPKPFANHTTKTLRFTTTHSLSAHSPQLFPDGHKIRGNTTLRTLQQQQQARKEETPNINSGRDKK
jgi:hypothetical protein